MGAFYKKENNELLIAPNFVAASDFELWSEHHAEYTYPVSGWYWFENDADARMALGMIENTPENFEMLVAQNQLIEEILANE